MSRSHRKHPVVAITTAETDKPFKTDEHRRHRRRVRQLIEVGAELPHHKAYGDPWNGMKDGKQRVPSDARVLRK